MLIEEYGKYTKYYTCDDPKLESPLWLEGFHNFQSKNDIILFLWIHNGIVILRGGRMFVPSVSQL